MLRYVVSFPGHLRQDQVEHFVEILREASDDRRWRDVVLAYGATITDMRRNHNPTPAVVRRARARYG